MIDHSVYSSRVEPNPYKALWLKMTEYERNYQSQLFLWISWYGTDGVRYGSYNYVNRKFLETRDYIVSWSSKGLSLLITDVLLDTVMTKSEIKFDHGVSPYSEDQYRRRILAWEGYEQINRG